MGLKKIRALWFEPKGALVKSKPLCQLVTILFNELQGGTDPYEVYKLVNGLWNRVNAKMEREAGGH